MASVRSTLVSLCLAGFALVLHGCSGCDSPAGTGGDGGVVTCEGGVDDDMDGFGEGCPAGADCNDDDPGLHDDCCAAGAYQGCPCDPSVDGVIPCFDGPPEVASNPPCMKGTRSCDELTSTWGACGGQVLPDDEICDGNDDDCDLEIDEDVQSACGNCLPGCDTVDVGDDPFPFPPADPNIDVDGVGLDPNGDLVLDSSTLENHFLWIANDFEGTVSKLDSRTGAEVARYATVSHEVLVNLSGGTVPAWNANTGGSAYADNRPSRTAVDFRSDVWVANRAHDFGGIQPSVTKITNAIEECVDRNGNTLIETSSDVDGDGVINIANAAEFFAESDECIAMTVAVGGAGANARALAIDQGIEPGDPGNVWVGMFEEQAFYQLNGATGSLIQRVPAAGGSGISPYGAAIDGQGRLWAPNGCCGISNMEMIQTNENPASYTTLAVPAFSNGGRGGYGITVDTEDRVWLGGWPQGGLLRYDPAGGTWTEATIPGLFNNGWGIRGVGIDTHGNVWGAVHYNWSDGQVARFDADTAVASGNWDIEGEIPVGVGVDFDGDVWTVNQNSSTASRLHIDQTTLEPADHPDTANTTPVDVFPVGPNPYTYSDFTGLGLRTVTRPSGTYTVPIQGCPGSQEAHWLGITWDATTPANTEVNIYVRSGNDLGTLEQQPLFGPWTVSPADLQVLPGPVPDGRYLLLTFELLSNDNQSTPIVHAYSVDWACPGEPIP
jgi:streptogramin lyase